MSKKDEAGWKVVASGLCHPHNPDDPAQRAEMFGLPPGALRDEGDGNRVVAMQASGLTDQPSARHRAVSMLCGMTGCTREIAGELVDAIVEAVEATRPLTLEEQIDRARRVESGC